MWAARRLSSPAEPHSQTRRSAAPFAHVGCSPHNRIDFLLRKQACSSEIRCGYTALQVYK